MRPDFTANLGGGVTLELVWIPGGTFDMGKGPTAFERAKRTVAGWFGKKISYPYIPNESPVHEVTLEGFWMGKCEVTQAQWEAVMGSNPSNYTYPDHPVERISWHQATEFCRKLSVQTGMKFALPSEAQWEYACRAGSPGERFFGDSENNIADYAWYAGNSKGQHHAVGTRKPNAWGLYDTYGNVWEWCQDSMQNNYRGAPANGDAWVLRGATYRVIRGGYWGDAAKYCRSAYRHRFLSDKSKKNIGFRIARLPQ